MQVKLNPNCKTFMCFIRDSKRARNDFAIALTDEDRGPKTVNASDLTEEERRQVIYNYRRGNLLVDGIEDLLNPQTPKVVPFVKQVVTSMVPLVEKSEIDMQAFLSQHHSTIKKDVGSLSLHELKAALKQEKNGKNRKSVLKSLKTILDKKESVVSKNLGGADVTSDSLVTTGMQFSSLVSEVEDEEESEEVLLIPPDQDLI